MNIDKINQELQNIFIKYGGIIKFACYLLIFILAIGLIFYFIDIHMTFVEIASDPTGYCMDKMIINYIP